ncbi:hypothetical protein E1160_00175 [Rhodospirillaceae bacterium RKSG073]|nr:hypothetical protein [Curvivirga aplysinae]
MTQPANGTVTVNADGTYTYTLAIDFKGDDSFIYRVTDPNGLGNVVTQAPPPVTNLLGVWP